jgi:hypothetical protein
MRRLIVAACVFAAVALVPQATRAEPDNCD